MNKQLFPIISGIMIGLLAHHFSFNGVFSIASFIGVVLAAALAGYILSCYANKK